MLMYFSSIGSLAALNVAVSEFIKTKLNISKKWVNQLISWIFPVLISIVGLVFGFGMFADFGTIDNSSAWVYTILTGIGSGLISNGLYSMEVVQAFIEFVKTLKVNKPE